LILNGQNRAQMTLLQICHSNSWLLSRHQETNQDRIIKLGVILFCTLWTVWCRLPGYGAKKQSSVHNFGVVSPGLSNINISFHVTWFEGGNLIFVPGIVWLADAGYTLSEHQIIPIIITGAEDLDPAHDAFNYCLSQLKIFVEMAVGRLVTHVVPML
jgi:hypothetical protein